MTKDLVFIASGGRTGTQFFGDKLGSVIEDCWSAHEPDLVDGLNPRSFRAVRRFGPWEAVIGKALGQTGVRVLGERYRRGEITLDQATRRLCRARARYHDSIPQSLIVESYYAWWPFAACIDRIFPGARMVGIVRDPSDWISSWLKQDPRRRGGDVERLASEWAMICETLISANVPVFRFEDLFGPDPNHMEALVRHIANGRSFHLPDRGQKRNASKAPRRARPNWSTEDARLLDAICGPLMRKYGYGLEPEWQAKLDGARNSESPITGSAETAGR